MRGSAWTLKQSGNKGRNIGKKDISKTWRSYMGRTSVPKDWRSWKPYRNYKSRKPTFKSNILSEQKEQELFCAWLDKNNIKYFAIPNGGYRKFMEGVNLKRCGVKRGVPDICVPIPSQTYHGAYIELKRVEKFIVSEEQKEWINYLQNQNYFASIACGHEEAIKLISDYLGLT